MHARYFTDQKSVKDAIRDELREQKEKVFLDVVKTILPQHTAMVCYVLHTRFGFGKKRLMEFLQAKNDLAEYLSLNKDVTGREVSTYDVMKSMQDYLHINFKVEKLSVQDTPKSRKKKVDLDDD